MLECPICGQPEILRQKTGNEQFVLFGCLFAVWLPTDKDDDELQRQLDEWHRLGGLDQWLKRPLFDPQNRIVVIKDPAIVDIVRKRFEEKRQE